MVRSSLYEILQTFSESELNTTRKQKKIRRKSYRVLVVVEKHEEKNIKQTKPKTRIIILYLHGVCYILTGK